MIDAVSCLFCVFDESVAMKNATEEPRWYFDRLKYQDIGRANPLCFRNNSLI